MPMKTKILLVDDHPLVREWLTNLINEEPDFEVCGQAGDAREALDLMGKLSPRIAVVDISLDGGSGLELIKDIKAQHPKIDALVLSMHDEALYAERAMRAGAAGYIMKREATSKVLDALRAVLAGGLYFSNAVNALLAQKLVQGAAGKPTPIEILSDRELEVFRLLGQGRGTRQIASDLHLSISTVETYRTHIKEKLRLNRAPELVRHAVEWVHSQA